MSRRNLNARQPAKNIGGKAPARKIMGADGVMITEKLCPIPFNKKFVAPDGDIVVVPLANGFTIRGFKGNDYGVQIMEEKLKAGFLPYNECPLMTKRVPRKHGETPCEGEFSNEKCCPHLDAVMKARRDDHRIKQLEYGKNFSTNQERMIALLESQAERMAKAEVQVTVKKGVTGG